MRKFGTSLKPGTFDTVEEAQAHLELRRQAAYERIKLEGETMLGDSSFVGCSMSEPGKYTDFLMITTKEMIDDLKKIHSIDCTAEFEKIIPDISEFQIKLAMETGIPKKYFGTDEIL